MIRKFKALGLALVALTAMTAVAAASASAAEFHAEAKSTTLSGSQVGENILTTKAGNVKCKTVTLSGTTSATSTTQQILNLHPTYGSCTAFGAPLTITTTGATYELDASGTMKIIGSTIIINNPSGNCSMTIPAQTPGVNNVSYTNEGSGASRDIRITSGVSQVKYTVDGPGTICGTLGTYEGVNGATLDGSVTVKGSTGIWVA